VSAVTDKAGFDTSLRDYSTGGGLDTPLRGYSTVKTSLGKHS